MTYAIIKGITLGLLLAISVGPIVFTVIKQSISNGRQGGLWFIAGIALSDILLVIVSNLFTKLLDALNAHKVVMANIASAFLIAVGLFYIFLKKPSLKDKAAQIKLRKRDSFRLVAAGFIMNLFNPGIILFWIGTATTFGSHSVNQRVVIFSIALIIAFTADILKVLLANQIGKKLTPQNIHKVDQLNGVILVLFGVGIILFNS